MTHAYELPELSPTQTRAAKHWLWVAVAALALSGIAPLVLLAGRASMFAEKDIIKSMFHSVLVVHVDLSVLVWFLAISCLMLAWFSAQNACKRCSVGGMGNGALIAMALGALFIAASPAHPEGEALMSNYIPVITNPIFFVGLGLVLAGTVVALLRFALAGIPAQPLPTALSPRSTDTNAALVFGIITTALIFIIAILAFLQTHHRIPSIYTGVDYYELLFWAGGHVLQFAWLQLLLRVWLILATAIGATMALKPYQLAVLFSFNLAICLLTPLPFIVYEISSFEFIHFFTQGMRHGGGLTALVVGAYVLVALIKLGMPTRENRVLWTVLVMSFTLFGAGGVLGYMIEGSNTIIPAHYHGSIIGISLAFMGLIYIALPKLGYGSVTQYKMAFWQPILLGVGQLMHIIGFAWAGGYGVMRKTAGELGEGMSQAEPALHLMRTGGLLAVLGGAFFVIVVIRAVRNKTLSP